MFTHSMTFDLGEDTNALRDMVHRWAQERVKPMAGKVDADNLFPSDLWREMGDLGLLGLTVDVRSRGWFGRCVDEAGR
jgi:isovaleryl-CoA dehydrogenase